MEKHIPDAAIVPCADYAPQNVRAALSAVLEPLGGLDWVKPGMKIAVKVNLIGAHKPQTAATTHPEPVKALCELLVGRGAEVTVGDCPGGPFNAVNLSSVYAACGMKDIPSTGAKLNDNFGVRRAEFPSGGKLQYFDCADWLCEADAIIDFCKLKTHAMMAYTGACKNFFGGIAGFEKAAYHYRFPDHDDFAGALVDLAEYFSPRLCICDAVMAMEGNGPTKGDPRFVGALIAAESPHKLDLLAASLIGLDVRSVPTLKEAFARGLIPRSAGELSVFGEPARFVVPDFRLQPEGAPLLLRSTAIGKFVRAAFAPRPVLHADDCVGCGKCAEVCPAKAIDMASGKPRIDRRKCITCFCCQEFCPKGAMRSRRGFFSF